ncbi:MAG TPA: hypothetical protein VHB79_39745 [Polyangiaceae bacterium]|nr:hypothetical protein [Polyangiaceae bacterium]
MTSEDAVLQALAKLPLEAPPSALSQKLLASGRARLVPAQVHPAWAVAIAASVVAYLGWALFYTGNW